MIYKHVYESQVHHWFHLLELSTLKGLLPKFKIKRILLDICTHETLLKHMNKGRKLKQKMPVHLRWNGSMSSCPTSRSSSRIKLSWTILQIWYNIYVYKRLMYRWKTILSHKMGWVSPRDLMWFTPTPPPPPWYFVESLIYLNVLTSVVTSTRHNIAINRQQYNNCLPGCWKAEDISYQMVLRFHCSNGFELALNESSQ